VRRGCLAIFGPGIADYAVPTPEAIEGRFKVPCMTMAGSEVALGGWLFSFPMGSHIDEPIFWSVLLAKGGHTEVGGLMEQPGSVAVRAVQVRCVEPPDQLVRRAGRIEDRSCSGIAPRDIRPGRDRGARAVTVGVHPRDQDAPDRLDVAGLIPAHCATSESYSRRMPPGGEERREP
jgi:hypothetical protein